MKKYLCLFGIHDWIKYWRSIPIKSSHDETISKFLHRECSRCCKKQLRTQRPSEFGSRDTNEWLTLNP